MANRILGSLLTVAGSGLAGAASGKLEKLKEDAKTRREENIARLNSQYRTSEITLQDKLARERQKEGFGHAETMYGKETERMESQAKITSDRQAVTHSQQLDEKRALAADIATRKDESKSDLIKKQEDLIKIFGDEEGSKLFKDSIVAKSDADKRENYAKFYTAYTKLHVDSGLPPEKVHKDAVTFAENASGLGTESGPSQPITILTGDAAKKRAAELIAAIRSGRANPAQLSARLQESGQTEVWRIIAEDARANKAKPKPSPILEASEVQTKGPAPFSSVTGKETEALGGGAKPTKRTGPPRKSLLTDIKEGVKEYHKPSGPVERRKKMEALAKRTGMSMDTILYFIDKVGDKILDMSVSEIKELLEKDQP